MNKVDTVGYYVMRKLFFLYRLPSIIRVIKSEVLWWTRHVA